MPPHFYERSRLAGLKIEIITFDSPTDWQERRGDQVGRPRHASASPPASWAPPPANLSW
jgi:hypothetical protein